MIPKMVVLIVAAVLCLILPSAQSANGIQNNQCGGAEVSDEDTFSYSGDTRSLTPGEVCVWTIHLDTMKDFVINFSDFSINSTTSDCSDAGIRLYTLTNLVPADELQSYTFCNAKPPPEEIFLFENVAVIVLYVNPLNSNPGSGFSITWKGSAYDSLQTTHLSTYSQTPSGSIRYPVVGSYDPNLAATWLIKSEESHEGQRSDIELSEITLETCDHPTNPCFCDAMIIYEINQDGQLNETQRFCENTVNVGLLNLEPQFIVAFFTDFKSQAEITKNGFDLVYYPSEDRVSSTTSTSTTEESETSETTLRPNETISTKCGEILGGTGKIVYKEEELLDEFEMCVWTIRIPTAEKILFELLTYGLNEFDHLTVTTFTRKSPQPLTTVHEYNKNLVGQPRVLEGNVAVIALTTRSGTYARGFRLRFEGYGETNQIISASSRDLLTDSVEGIIYHPERVEGDDNLYDFNELSTFLFARPGFKETGHVENGPWNRCILWIYGIDPCCECDFIYLYFLELDTGRWYPLLPYCRGDTDAPWGNDGALLWVFVSDDTGTERGFSFELQEVPGDSEMPRNTSTGLHKQPMNY